VAGGNRAEKKGDVFKLFLGYAPGELVNEKHITQVVFGHSATRGWKTVFLPVGNPSVFA
jgi:hypothetical protein